MLPVQVWKDQTAPPIALLTCFIKKYGGDALEWEAEVARKELEDDYGFKISDLQSDKLQAAISVLCYPYFETDWQVFENICHLFSNNLNSFDSLEPLAPEEIISGLAEASLIRHDPIDFSSDVNVYAGLVFFEAGFSKAPELFPTAVMPKGNDSSDKEKNTELESLFDFRFKRSSDYLASLS